MVAPRTLQTGQILDDTYRLTRHIADGGMGTVYEAEHVQSLAHVAIKALNPEFSQNPDVLKRFHKEAQAASAIGHEHIVDVLGMGRDPNGSLFIVMELLQGKNLADTLAGHAQGMPFDRAARIMQQVLEALSAAHRRGIVHRDLKPENIFLCNRGGDPDFVKVLDFGVSKVLVDQARVQLSATGFVLGTPHYMSPEQARGGQLDKRVDIYACGVMLYQLVTGRLPFTAPNFNALMFEIAGGHYSPPRQWVPDLPQGFEQVIQYAMRVDPNQRYASAEQLSAALTAFVGAAGSRPQPVPSAPSQASAGGVGRLWAMIVLGALLGGGGGAAAVVGLASQGAEKAVLRPQVVSYTSDLKSVLTVTAPPKRPAANNMATLTFEITPPEAAEIVVIKWDGEVVDGNSIEARVGSKTHKLDIKARGYSRISRKRLKVSKSETLSFELKPRKKSTTDTSTGPGGELEL